MAAVFQEKCGGKTASPVCAEVDGDVRLIGLVTVGSANGLVASDILCLVSSIKEEEGWRANLAAVRRVRASVVGSS